MSISSPHDLLAVTTTDSADVDDHDDHDERDDSERCPPTLPGLGPGHTAPSLG